MSRIGFCGLVLWLAACSAASPLPEMQPGETGRVVRIIDGDALILETGQSVRLVSIEAPVLYPRDRDADPFAAESARLLEDMALGRRVQLYYPGITRDRYDRALAHVVTIDGAGPDYWLNQEMLKRGGAWVRLYPDTAARGEDLLSNEQMARDARLGLWARAAYQMKPAGRVDDSTLGFRLIDAALGPLLPIAPDTPYPPACLRELQGARLKLSVRRDAQTLCGLPDGTRLLLRGYIRDQVLDLTYPRHAQALGPD